MTDRSLSTGSSGSNNSGNANRQSSQTSLFEQLASQAKDLVRESTRQSSQEKLLAQMDKVMTSALPFTLEYDDFNFIFCFIQP